MKEIIEYEVYRYTLRLKECYDSNGRLTHYPTRKPLQCMVLKNFADRLSSDLIYSRSQLETLILDYISFEAKESILDELVSFGFIIAMDEGKSFRKNEHYLDCYRSFLGLD